MPQRTASIGGCFEGQVSVLRTGLSGIAAWMLFLSAAAGCVLLLFLAKGLLGGMLVAVAVLVWAGVSVQAAATQVGGGHRR